jgi:SNF2 family DNA or RNA helicase
MIYGTPPRTHQQVVLEATWQEPYWGLFLDMGTGKSKILIDTISNLYVAGKIDAAIIFAPKSTCINWRSIELKKHWPTEVPCRWSYSKSNPSKRLKSAWKRLGRFEGCKIFVQNIESLSFDSGLSLAMAFCKKFEGRLLMAVDESTCIKTAKAARSRALAKLTKYSTYRRILSGNPYPQSPEDIYNQFEFLEHGLLDVSTLAAFRARYSVVQPIQIRINPKPGQPARTRQITTTVGVKNLEELQAKIQKYSTRIKWQDCIDLPEKTYQSIMVEMGAEQRRVYTQMREQAVTLLRNGMVSAPHALTQLGKLRQIACGFVRDDNGTVATIDRGKIRALEALINETDGKVVVWSTYTLGVLEIAGALRDTYGEDSVVVFHGQSTVDEREEAIQRFQEDDTCRFFVGNQSAGQFSITLTAASIMAYFANSFSVEQRVQSEARIHRMGQTNACRYYDILTQGTVDEWILEQIQKKFNISAQLSGDILLKALESEYDEEDE